MALVIKIMSQYGFVYEKIRTIAVYNSSDKTITFFLKANKLDCWVQERRVIADLNRADHHSIAWEISVSFPFQLDTTSWWSRINKFLLGESGDELYISESWISSELGAAGLPGATNSRNEFIIQLDNSGTLPVAFRSKGYEWVVAEALTGSNSFNGVSIE
ncbi:hypothetical protein AgCh_027853 [Apium graveolens]